MKVIRSKSFNRSFAKLPKDIQRLFLVQEERFRNNWQDPRLHLKKIADAEHAFSFRVTRNWRVLFYFQNRTTVVFFMVDNRKDVYR